MLRLCSKSASFSATLPLFAALMFVRMVVWLLLRKRAITRSSVSGITTMQDVSRCWLCQLLIYSAFPSVLMVDSWPVSVKPGLRKTFRQIKHLKKINKPFGKRQSLSGIFLAFTRVRRLKFWQNKCQSLTLFLWSSAQSITTNLSVVENKIFASGELKRPEIFVEQLSFWTSMLETMCSLVSTLSSVAWDLDLSQFFKMVRSQTKRKMAWEEFMWQARMAWFTKLTTMSRHLRPHTAPTTQQSILLLSIRLSAWLALKTSTWESGLSTSTNS